VARGGYELARQSATKSCQFRLGCPMAGPVSMRAAGCGLIWLHCASLGAPGGGPGKKGEKIYKLRRYTSAIKSYALMPMAASERCALHLLQLLKCRAVPAARNSTRPLVPVHEAVFDGHFGALNRLQVQCGPALFAHLGACRGFERARGPYHWLARTHRMGISALRFSLLGRRQVEGGRSTGFPCTVSKQACC